MSKYLKLPVGIENFEKIRREGFYYIDKTLLIRQLLEHWGEVNLFTRPRRFGKTLNMSMLKYFFEVGTDETLFDGLDISKDKKLCEEYQGRYPVIFLSLKGVDGLSFQKAVYHLKEQIGREAERFSFLSDSEHLAENEKRSYNALIKLQDGKYTMDEELLESSLKILSQLLHKHYGKKTIILIDEYDVPLDKAFGRGYYKEMVALLRSLFGNALKTNDSLQFAVLTGCLRVSKESIFTGLNNFKVLSITDARFDEQFGFTEEEVVEILNAYQLKEHLAEMKRWYDGYRFGDTDIYCPWDVINHVDRLLWEPDTEPQAYWINSSGNDLVKRFIDKADRTTRDELEQLVAGGMIDKRVRLELTYDEIDNSIDNLWSVLFTTGYLTQAGKPERGVYRLRIPNEEIREVFKSQIQEWFKRRILKDTDGLKAFWHAFENGDADGIERYLTKTLSKTISVLDPKGPEVEKEKFYHAFLSGMLAGNGEWGVFSNKEAGEGFADLLVETDDPNAGIVIELKSVNRLTELEGACQKAMAQIHDRGYEAYFRNEGRDNIRAYGIAFYKKRCRVITETSFDADLFDQALDMLYD